MVGLFLSQALLEVACSVVSQASSSGVMKDSSAIKTKKKDDTIQEGGDKFVFDTGVVLGKTLKSGKYFLQGIHKGLSS